MLRALTLATSLCMAPAAQACDVALLLAVDISGSVDPAEYDLQRGGLALALRDGSVAEALVRANALVSVMQWTGSSRQRITIPWVQIHSFADVDRLAAQVETDARVWRNFSTAIGDALFVAIEAFEAVPHCERKVIDVSGDGISNEGRDPANMKAQLTDLGITVNALVIETSEEDLTGYFWENVITGAGAFVVTANDYRDYPARIREKLLREIVPQLSDSGTLRQEHTAPANFVITAQ